MPWDEEETTTTTIYKVVNHEEQYSIWPADRENALGWFDADRSGSKQECLNFIQEVWTDMRPLSLRKQMDELAHKQLANPTPPPQPIHPSGAPVMDELVQRLSIGQHPIIASGSNDSAKELQQSIARNFVYIKFTQTQGGTELGMCLDNAAIDLSHASFDHSEGYVRLVGQITLNYVNVRCVAVIDLVTLEGTGHLEPIEQPS